MIQRLLGIILFHVILSWDQYAWIFFKRRKKPLANLETIHNAFNSVMFSSPESISFTQLETGSASETRMARYETGVAANFWLAIIKPELHTSPQIISAVGSSCNWKICVWCAINCRTLVIYDSVLCLCKSQTRTVRKVTWAKSLSSWGTSFYWKVHLCSIMSIRIIRNNQNFELHSNLEFNSLIL